MPIKDINLSILSTIIAVHFLTVFLLLKVDFRQEYVIWAIGIYYFRWLGFTCAVHRYFSHKVCRTSRWFQFVLGVLGVMTMARSPIRFASGHRHHHIYSDSRRDLHSFCRHGLFMSYVGWVISKRYDEDKLGHVGDLKRYPELVCLNRFYFIPNLIFLLFLYQLGGGGLLTYGGLLSIILVWHTAFAVTVSFHTIGKATYNTGDNSRNSFWLAILTLGEGWHNNHHSNMSSAKMGHEWWQIDCGYYVLLVFEQLGLIWDLNKSTDPVQLIPAPNDLQDADSTLDTCHIEINPDSMVA
jgi:stearoyl-CoA desaturase (Delta-9 desaturase)